jgi:hypothetical protein
LNDITETSIRHQAFDNTLFRQPIMNISNKTSVPALNAPLTSSYLHAAGGMTAHTDATPTSLLLFHIKEGTVITTATHKQSLFLLCIEDNSVIMATSLLLLYNHDNPAIMTSLNAQNLMLFFVQNDPANQASKLIVKYSKTSLHFRKDCGTFCEGEWVQHRRLDEHNNLVGISLIGHSGLARLTGFDGLICLVNFIGLDVLIGLIGIIDRNGLTNLIGLIGLIAGLVGLVGLIDCIAHIGCNGYNSLVG